MSQLNEAILAKLEDNNREMLIYLEDNFSRIFSLLAPLISFSVQNENHMRQVMNSLLQSHMLDSINYLNNSMADENNTSRNESTTTDNNNNYEEPQPSSSRARASRKRKLNQEGKVDAASILHCIDCKQDFVRGDGSYTRHLKEMKCSPHGCAGTH